MKKIYRASLTPTGTITINGNYCEWAWTEKNEADYGQEWDGRVLDYVKNLDLEDGLEINEDYKGAIHNEPENAVILTYENEPVAIYWAE